MTVSLQDVLDLRNELAEEHEVRHQSLRRLRDFWHGKYWELASEESGARSVTSIFRDLIASRADVGPDIKLVHNLIQEVCVKYQTYLSPLPMIRMFVDPPGTPTRRTQATLKERYLYGAWQQGKMDKIFNNVSWYLPLMGHCYLGIYPDFDKSLPCPSLRSPECAYPLLSAEGYSEDGVIFSWEIPERRAARSFPNYQPSDEVRGQQRARFGGFFGPNRASPQQATVQVIEYSDSNEFARWVGAQKVNGVEHGFGFNLFDPVKFIDVPDEVWGHGAVEQAVNLVEMGNALYSLMFQAVLENVFPKLVLIDPMKAPEQMDLGIGGVIPINAGGKAEWLTPPVGALGAQAGMLASNEQAVKQATAMPDVNFGQMHGSIVTGKAINELQGAGTGSTIEMVQGCGIGSAVVSWNEKAILMGQTMFHDDEIQLFGRYVDSFADIGGRRFAMKIKGKQLIGSPQNEVVFSPTMSMHEKVVMGLQMAGAGLVSKEWQRNQVGIPDSEAMDEEIITEQIQDAVVGGIVQGLMAAGAPTPEAAANAEDTAIAFLAGATPSAPAGLPPGMPPQLPAATGPGGGGPGVAPPGVGPGTPPGPPPGPPPSVTLPPGPNILPQQPPLLLPVPGQGGPPQGGPQGAPSSGSQTVTLDEVVGYFQSPNLQGKINGRVFLVGEIVRTGQTDGDVEVAVTDSSDISTLTDFIPQLAGRLTFHHVAAEPNEPHIEVTPGVQPQQGGQEPNPGDLFA